MKRNLRRNLFVLMLLMLGIGSVRADLVWYEGYNYPNGRIDIVSTNASGGTNWARHSGSGNDANLTNGVEFVGSSGSSPARSDDVHRDLTNSTTVYTNSTMLMYASFTISVTQLPGGTTNAGYFAHFLNGTGNFYGKVWCGNGSLPGTYRLGTTGAGSTAPIYYPIDLATNTPYQVVISYDAASSRSSTLWVNPISQSDFSVQSSDIVSSQSNLMSFAFRQGASSLGSTWAFYCGITNLAVATTFPEAATNVASTNAVTPVIMKQPVGFTNFVGSSNAIAVVVNGQGLGSMTYQWFLGATPITTVDGNPVGNTNVLSFPSAVTNDNGSYTVVATTPYGLSITSNPTSVSVSAAPVPPTINSGPVSLTAYPNQTVTFSVNVTSPGNVSYQWKSNNINIPGQTFSTLTLSGVTTNFAASYSVGVTNDVTPNGVVSTNAVLTVLVPPVVTINYLRGLVDPVFLLPTNTTLYYTTTGTVITKTNYTTSANNEFFIDDGTGGISVFYGGASTFQPNFGDVVTVTGPISQFNSLLEFSLSATDPSTSATIISSNNPAPLPAGVLPLTFTNSVAFGGTSNALRNWGGRLLMFTNITITPGGGSNTFSANGTYTMTDPQGNTLTLFVYSGFTNLIGMPVPSFCYTLTGVASTFLSATAPDRSSGYQMETPDIADFVTTPPSAVTLHANGAGAVTWNATPYAYPYTIYGATNVTGPYLPLKAGMVFPTSAGSYTDTNPIVSAKFYRVTSP